MKNKNETASLNDNYSGKKMKKSTGLFGSEYQQRAKDILSQRFIVPPFSVLNTREGFWQTRKQQWISIGIKSELGRGENLLKYSDTILEAQRGGKPFAITYGSGAPGDLSKDMKRRSLIKPKGLTFRINDADEYRKKEAVKRGLGATPTNKSASIAGFNEWRKKTNYGKGLTGNTSDIEQFAKKVRGGLAREAGPKGEGKSVYLHPVGETDDEVIGGTSIFDPVLCELVYRWFAPDDGRVLDPFAGGSVRGIMAGETGLHYHGIDLSGQQLEANRQQAKIIGTKPVPVWIEGDSVDVAKLVKPLREFDLVFSCPPYGDLEKYSDDPRDLSALSSREFDEKYDLIISEACALLKPDSFAVFVVGDYRDKDGFYCNLPAKTIAAFEEAGLRLYNEIVLLNAIGSLPLRINAQFNGSRKVGKCHQNVLVFVKGQPREFIKNWSVNRIGDAL